MIPSNEAEAISTVALIAALADGRRQAEERARLADLAASLGTEEHGVLTRKILAGQVRLSDAIGRIGSEEGRRAAFELAVSVCNADGIATTEEQEFLDDLASSLRLDEAFAKAVRKAGENVARTPPAAPTLDAPDLPLVETAGGRPSQAGLPALDPEAALDGLIERSAMLAGALELLPQALAGLLVVAVQGRMVHRIGADFGDRPGAEQVRDLAKAVGIGAAAQVLEGGARRALGGLLGRTVGGAAGTVTGAAFAFATTYALGHVAKRYYAQGRELSGQDLRAMFEELRAEGRARFPALEERIKAQADSLSLPALLDKLG
ncbi:MAG: DUF533 domain-containing protein [Gemmatimonadales bacterium]